MTAGANNEGHLVDELLAQIAALKSQLDTTTKQLDTTTKQLDTTTKQLDTTTKQVKVVEQRAERLKLQVKRLAYLLYGRRSEKLSADELGQLVLSFGGSDEDARATEPDVPVPTVPEEVHSTEDAAENGKPRKKRKHPGRTELSPRIERIVTDVPVPDADRACKCCGVTMTAITPREPECVEHVPEKLIVQVERRETLVCKNSSCRSDTVTAERTPTPMIVRRAGVSLYANLIENKCDDALPIYRQRDRLLRLGFDIPLNTLYGYWTHATGLLSIGVSS